MSARLWPFVLGSVALGLDAYVIAGLLPAIAADLGAGQAMVGLGVTAFTLAYAVCGPLLAGAAGRRSRRGLVLALTVFTLANAVTALSGNLVVFLLARLVAGAAAGVYSPLSSALAAALADPGRRGRALATVLAGLAMGTVFGVPLGLLLARSLGWRATIGLVAVIGLVALVGVGLKPQRRGPGRGDRFPSVEAPSARARIRTFTQMPTLLTTSVTLLTGVASLGLYTYITPLLSEGALGGHLTLAIWVWGIGGAVGVMLIGRLLDATGRPMRVTLAITASLALVLIVIAMAPPTGILLVALFLWGLLGWSSLAPQQETLLGENPNDGATAVAANASANYLGSALGSAGGAAVVAAGASGSMLAALASVPAVLAVLVQAVRMRMASRHA